MRGRAVPATRAGPQTHPQRARRTSTPWKTKALPFDLGAGLWHRLASKRKKKKYPRVRRRHFRSAPGRRSGVRRGGGGRAGCLNKLCMHPCNVFLFYAHACMHFHIDILYHSLHHHGRQLGNDRTTNTYIYATGGAGRPAAPWRGQTMKLRLPAWCVGHGGAGRVVSGHAARLLQRVCPWTTTAAKERGRRPCIS